MTDGPLSGFGPADSRFGVVSLIGAPNAGKSTLLNRIIGTKVSIVSPKVQTTRSRVLGIWLEGAVQIAFVDTPGIFAPRRRLDRSMVRAAWDGAGEADRVLVLVDARQGISQDVTRIIETLAKRQHPKAMKPGLILNKVDLVQKDKLLELAAQLGVGDLFGDVFMVSALTGDGVGDLLENLAASTPPGPWHYPEDQISDMPQRLLASEITREKLYLQLQQELPYRATVETEAWTEQKDGSARIEQVIYVERDSQKAIVLGKGGKRIKALGGAARKELEELLERRIHLFLFVKVRDGWENDPERYREMGLDFNA
ncbi:MAG: GTPase Era [Magnetovibrionaceae bacterium]